MNANFHKSTVYQIYPKSFRDTTGSGVGDLNGVTEKLDYIAGLGVDYIWLTPFFPSPQVDNGYDVADYCDVDPRFGTMADLERLIAEAGRRGIGLMLDMVFNHTSDEHIWFRKALQGEQKYLDYYLFRPGKGPGLPPNDWDNTVAPGSAWEYVPHLDLWYLHLYDKKQPDLNWDNPAVREELKNVIRFWMDKGIRGFRFDVLNQTSKAEGLPDDGENPGKNGKRFYTDGPHIHEYIQELVRDTGLDKLVTVGEMASTSLAHCQRYSNPKNKELSMVFSFHHMKADYRENSKWKLMPFSMRYLKDTLTEWQLGMQEAGAWNAVFWCNHDQPRVVSRYGDDGKYWAESAKMLAMAKQLLRGTPYIYQGEELGMTNVKNYDDISDFNDTETLQNYDALIRSGSTPAEALEVMHQRSRDNARTPMQWNGGRNAGFSDGEHPWLKVNANYETINAARQVDDPDSILAFYRALVELRKENDVISDGSFEPYLHEREDVFAYFRRLGGKTLLVVCNFYGAETEVPAPEAGAEYRLLLANYADTPADRFPARLRPYEAVAYWVE